MMPMMPRLEPGTGDTDWGLWQTFTQGFFKLSQVGFNCSYSFTFWSVLCRCNCPLLKAALVSTKVLSEILTQEYDNNILTKWSISNFFFRWNLKFQAKNLYLPVLRSVYSWKPMILQSWLNLKKLYCKTYSDINWCPALLTKIFSVIFIFSFSPVIMLWS